MIFLTVYVSTLRVTGLFGLCNCSIRGFLKAIKGEDCHMTNWRIFLFASICSDRVSIIL